MIAAEKDAPNVGSPRSGRCSCSPRSWRSAKASPFLCLKNPASVSSASAAPCKRLIARNGKTNEGVESRDEKRYKSLVPTLPSLLSSPSP